MFLGPNSWSMMSFSSLDRAMFGGWYRGSGTFDCLASWNLISNSKQHRISAHQACWRVSSFVAMKLPRLKWLAYTMHSRCFPQDGVGFFFLNKTAIVSTSAGLGSKIRAVEPPFAFSCPSWSAGMAQNLTQRLCSWIQAQIAYMGPQALVSIQIWTQFSMTHAWHPISWSRNPGCHHWSDCGWRTGSLW